MRVYQAITQQYAPDKTVAFGVSAGGNLILSALLKADLAGLPMPAAVGLFTPWVDLTGTGDSYQSNDGRDAVVAWKNQLSKAARAYVGKAELRDPLISPIYSDYPKRFPPVMITTGTRDLLLSDCTRLYWILRNANIPVSLRVWEGMWHAVNVEPEIPEGKLIREEMAKFLVESFNRHTAP